MQTDQLFDKIDERLKILFDSQMEGISVLQVYGHCNNHVSVADKIVGPAQRLCTLKYLAHLLYREQLAWLGLVSVAASGVPSAEPIIEE